MTDTGLIGVDWGTSSFRAYRLDAAGTVQDRIETDIGILEVPDGDFPAALRAALGSWLTGNPVVLLCGMVGSRQGWREAPYLAAPAGPAEIAARLVELPFDGARCRLVPGHRTTDAQGVPDVMRGEETKLVGLLAEIGDAPATACLPGTHPKWARLEGGRITGFGTHMTGEVRAALLGHTILGRTAPEGRGLDAAAFRRGVARSADPGGLLHHLFGTRALHLLADLPESAGESYLSGLLIGHEVRSALPRGSADPIHLAGSETLMRTYALAFDALGIPYRRCGADLVAAGLARIGATP